GESLVDEIDDLRDSVFLWPPLRRNEVEGAGRLLAAGVRQARLVADPFEHLAPGLVAHLEGDGLLLRLCRGRRLVRVLPPRRASQRGGPSPAALACAAGSGASHCPPAALSLSAAFSLSATGSIPRVFNCSVLSGLRVASSRLAPT